jgi:hypothetical protein
MFSSAVHSTDLPFLFYSGSVYGKLQETSLKYQILTGHFLVTNNAICHDVKARTVGFRT